MAVTDLPNLAGFGLRGFFVPAVCAPPAKHRAPRRAVAEGHGKRALRAHGPKDHLNRPTPAKLSISRIIPNLSMIVGDDSSLLDDSRELTGWMSA